MSKKRAWVTLSMIALLFHTFISPIQAFAQQLDSVIKNEENHSIQAIIDTTEEEPVPIFKEETSDSKILTYVMKDDIVTVIERNDSFSLVEYVEKDSESQFMTGYIDNQYLAIVSDESSELELEENNSKLIKEESTSSSENEISSTLEENSKSEESISESEEKYVINEAKKPGLEVAEKKTRKASLLNNTQKTYRGIALKNRTHVYADTARNKSLKSYSEGSILKYQFYNSSWYKATVYIFGKAYTGFINKSDVENIHLEQKALSGVALNDKTDVYSSASTNSKILKSYSKGAILKYKTFSKNWYEATVFVNGKRKTGYIHKSHVENREHNPVDLVGIALKSKTNVYSSASTNSNVLKAYNAGSILKYKTFTSNWYEATVYVNGKRKTGYIHKSHVENREHNPVDLVGVALKSKTNVYSSASTNSNVLKAYNAGSILKYKTFTSNWYEATVYVNGKRKIGYIHKSHVDTGTSQPKNLKGIGLRDKTNVYSTTSTSSKVLKSYSEGTILKFKTFTTKWYEATVYVNGKPKVGYIHKSHVSEIYDKQKALEGRATKTPTHVYSLASKKSKPLKSYGFGSLLKYRTFAKDWYIATVYINGKPHTGYIHVDDVGEKNLVVNTKYDYTFKSLVDRQMGQSPKSDGAGRIPATRGEVEFYANPLNFTPGTASYLQFLVLSQPIGLSAYELNELLLKEAGVLSGTGDAFVEASRKYQINEVYLVAHALHETGNGKSGLSTGIPVDKNGKVTRNSRGEVAKTEDTAHFVYNMYGYGAYDSCPIDCGAKYAFDKKWFTLADSIVGGAESIFSYINRGQNTLYKMRWNPDPNIPDYLQYATHVQWAVLQTNNMAKTYESLNKYSGAFDVPTFNQLPDYKKGAAATTQASSLNFRNGPGTGYNIIGSLSKGSKIKIIGANPNGWYKIDYNGKVGWVSATYVHLD